jgi:hypothetical protein
LPPLFFLYQLPAGAANGHAPPDTIVPAYLHLQYGIGTPFAVSDPLEVLVAVISTIEFAGQIGSDTQDPLFTYFPALHWQFVLTYFRSSLVLNELFWAASPLTEIHVELAGQSMD